MGFFKRLFGGGKKEQPGIVPPVQPASPVSEPVAPAPEPTPPAEEPVESAPEPEPEVAPEEAPAEPERAGMGPGGECVCPACGAKAPHQTGVPCTEQKCPACGQSMIRAEA